MAWPDTARSRRDIIRGALKGTAYAAPVVLAAAVPRAVAAASPVFADLVLTLTANPSNPLVGGTTIITLTITNAGPGAATGVVVTDKVPAGFTLVTFAVSQGTYDPATGIWLVGALAAPPGAARHAGVERFAPLALTNAATLQLTVTANGAGTDTAAITHSDQPDPNAGNNTASLTVTPGAPSADLALTKTVDKPTANIGDIVTFTLALSNGGPSAATGVTVTDTLPQGLNFVNATASQGAYTAATGLWDVGTLAVGVGATLAIRARVTQNGTFPNAATVSHSDQADPTPGNNQARATVSTATADLAVTTAVRNPTPLPINTVTFRTSVTNNGPNTATNVTVTDAVPAGTTFDTASPSGTTTYDSATGIWTVGTLAAGATATLDLMVDLTVIPLRPPPTVTNNAAVAHSDQADPVPGNNSATATYAPQAADLQVFLLIEPQYFSPGSYSFKVRLDNFGPSAATGVRVHNLFRDFKPGAVFTPDPGTTFTPDPGTTVDNQTGTWAVPSLASGAMIFLTISRTLTAGERGVIFDGVVITHSDQFDPDDTNNDDSSGSFIVPGVP